MNQASPQPDRRWYENHEQIQENRALRSNRFLGKNTIYGGKSPFMGQPLVRGMYALGKELIHQFAPLDTGTSLLQCEKWPRVNKRM